MSHATHPEGLLTLAERHVFSLLGKKKKKKVRPLRPIATQHMKGYLKKIVFPHQILTEVSLE